MACQQIDRICYAMEIDPRYVTATIHRYRAMFPEQPIQLIRQGKLQSIEDTQSILS